MEDIPVLLAVAHAVREVLEFGERKGLGHAEGLGAVVEVGEEVYVLAGEGLLERGLVHAAEGTWGDGAFGVLLQCLLGDAAAGCGGAGGWAGHVDCDLFTERVATG